MSPECPECQETFDTWLQLHQHIEIHMKAAGLDSLPEKDGIRMDVEEIRVAERIAFKEEMSGDICPFCKSDQTQIESEDPDIHYCWSCGKKFYISDMKPLRYRQVNEHEKLD